MRVDKLYLFKKLLEKYPGVTPVKPEFEAKVIALLKEEISEVANLFYVGPDTFQKVDDDARKFSSKMRILWRDSRVCILKYF